MTLQDSVDMPTWNMSKASTTYGCICLVITHIKTFYATPNDMAMALIQSCCYRQYLERSSKMTSTYTNSN